MIALLPITRRAAPLALPELDLPTLRLATAAIVAATVLALLVFWRRQVVREESRYWAAGILAYAAAFFIIAFFNLETSKAVNVLVDLMLVGSSLLLLHGYREMMSLAGLRRTYALLLGLTLAVSFYFNYLDEQLN